MSLPQSVKSMQLNVLPIERIWKSERRSRDYRRMCRNVAKDIAEGIIHQKDIIHYFLRGIGEDAKKI